MCSKYCKDVLLSQYGLVKRQMFDYNVPNGKLSRSCLLVHSYMSLKPVRDEQEILKICKIGWALEMMQSCFLIIDDVMDGSFTRRGRQCWHRLRGYQENVGLTAINDALFLENCISILISEELDNHPSLSDVQRAILEAKVATIVGQKLDSQKARPESCSWDRYLEVVHHKTSHYSFWLPIQLACFLAKIDLKTFKQQLKEICYDIGYYFQAQDDFLDVYGDPVVTGKIGTDIADGKLSWLVVSTVSSLSPEISHWEVFWKNFSDARPECVSAVKNVFRHVKVSDKFLEFESEILQKLSKKIALVEPAELRPVLSDLVDSLHSRKK